MLKLKHSKFGKIGNNIRFVERSKGVYRAVLLGKPSVGWWLKTV
jgi:hypothetical protein